MDKSKSHKGSRIDSDSSSNNAKDAFLKVFEKYSEDEEHCDLESLAVFLL